MDFNNESEDDQAGPSEEEIEQLKKRISEDLGIPEDQIHAHVINNPTPDMIQQLMGNSSPIAKSIQKAEDSRSFLSAMLGQAKPLAMLARMNQLRGLEFFDAETDGEKQAELLEKYEKMVGENLVKEFGIKADKMKAAIKENPDLSIEDSVREHASFCLHVAARELREVASILDDIQGMYNPQEVEEESDDS